MTAIPAPRLLAAFGVASGPTLLAPRDIHDAAVAIGLALATGLRARARRGYLPIRPA